MCLEQKKTVSVIVPVYKSEQYLFGCIESLIAQVHQELEIILIDDGSPDRCGEICDMFSKRDSRVKVVHHENRGVSAARNTGLSIATGDFVGFLDSDDRVEPDMYSTLYSWITEKDTDIVACGYYEHYHNEKVFSRKPFASIISNQEQAFLAAIQPVYFNGFLWNKLFRRKLFDSGFRLNEDIRLCEDLYLLCQMIEYGATIYYHSTPLYHYNLKKAGTMSSYHTYRDEELEARALIIDIGKRIGLRAENLAKCHYSIAAAEIRAMALCAGDKNIAAMMNGEARRYLRYIYYSGDMDLLQKIKAIIKVHFPFSWYIYDRYTKKGWDS